MSASPSFTGADESSDSSDSQPRSGTAMAPSRARLRRVCNLTPTQIEKKRAIDRANQRHWRKKKRLHIEELEAEVARLKAQLAESESRVRQFEALSTAPPEPADLGSIMTAEDGVLEPATTSSSSVSTTAASVVSDAPEADSPTNAVEEPITDLPVEASLLFEAAMASANASAMSTNDILWPLDVTGQDIPSSRSYTSDNSNIIGNFQPVYNGDLRRADIFDSLHSFQLPEYDVDYRTNDDYTINSLCAASAYIPCHQGYGLRQHQVNHHRGYPHHNYNRYTPVPRLLPSLGHACVSPYYKLARRGFRHGDAVPDWLALPPNLPPSTELDKLILITSHALSKQYSTREFSQPVYPSIEGLLSSPAHHQNMTLTGVSSGNGDAQPLLSALAQHVIVVSPLRNLTSRIAFLYALAYLLRWYVCRTKESYDALPDHMKPTPLQRNVPHPVWVDFIVWPDVRDSIIRKGDYSFFEMFRFVTGKSMSVNWPYTDSGTFVECEDESGRRLALNPLFEAHIRNPRNYSVDGQAAAVFPALQRYARVTVC